MAARQMKVEVYPAAGNYHWRIVAANGTTIADSALNKNSDGSNFRGYPRSGRALEIAEKVAMPLPVIVRQ